MPVAKVSHQTVEVLQAITASAKVSQDIVEVVRAFTPPTALTPVSASSASLGSYGDECNSGTLDGAWTLRNIASVTGNGTEYSILLDAQGDAMTRSFTDTGLPISIMAHLTGMTDAQPMIGICALDSSNNGVAFSRYNNGSTYLWRISSYNYASTGPGISSVPTIGDHWLHLMRDGSAQWKGRYSSDGSAWSVWTSLDFDNRTISHIGILRAYTGASQTIGLERFVCSADVSGFTGGAMVSHNVVEVLTQVPPVAKVGQSVVEILMTGAGADPPPSAATIGYGYST